MISFGTIRSERYIGLVSGLAILVAVSLVMTGFSLLVYLRSDTSDVVRIIQSTSQGSYNITEPSTGIDNDGVLSISELLFIKEGVEEQRQRLNPGSDFSSSTISEDNLGL